MENEDYEHVVFHAYARTNVRIKSEILAEASQVLNAAEFTALRKYLTAANPRSCIRSGPGLIAGFTYNRFNDLIKSGTEKLVRHFDSVSQHHCVQEKPHIPYHLVDLICFAESASNDNRAKQLRPWNLLTENLAVLARAPPSTPQQARVQLNLWQVLNALYLRPISELTNRYHADRRLVRILDLYFLTGDELSRTHACGPKTIERLDFVLHAKGLPGIDEVVK